MSARWARVNRGLGAAVLSTFVAALFHVAGGGAVPSSLAITVSLTFSSLACIALAGHRLRLWSLTISVVLSQLAFHALFSLGQGVQAGSSAIAGTTAMSGSSGMATMTGMAGTAGRTTLSGLGESARSGGAGIAGAVSHGATAHGGTAGALTGMSGMQELIPTSPLMWVFHAVAALVTIATIRSASQSLTAIQRLARVVVRLLLGFSQPEPIRRMRLHSPRAVAVQSRTALSVLLRRGMRHRGPPILFATSA